MILRNYLLAFVLLPYIAASVLPQQEHSPAKRHEGHEEEESPDALMSMHENNEQTNVDQTHAEMAHGPTHSHGAPKEFLDPADLAPEPLSYYVHDTTDPDSYGGWMTAHIFFMTSSWLGLYPLTLFLRAAKHPLYHFAQLLFLATTIFGLLCSRIYKAETEDLYPHNKHSSIGWFVVLTALACFALDTITIAQGVYEWYKSGGGASRLGPLLLRGIKSKHVENETIYESIVTPSSNLSDVEEEVSTPSDSHDTIEDLQRRRGHRVESSNHIFSYMSMSRDSSDTLHDNERHVKWTTDSNSSNESPVLKRTLTDSSFEPSVSPSRAFLHGFLKYFHTFVLRSLLVAGYASVILGIVVYSGKCRSTFLNGCLAHLIKGSIFLGWGLLSFGRYLGAWSELGWAWNRKPATTSWRRHAPSAEFVECLLIFTYGCTNTFMERFGAKKGDAFSIHQIQHISIAILFFGAGAFGLALESKSIRRFLAGAVEARLGPNAKVAIPPSYSASFNPIPAITAALTGISMGAHHQSYVFAIKIHQLWGYQLVLFGLCRILTYTFMWLRPPTSVLPSRPPTEALASFFCACGGFVFMLSTEQVVFSTMLAGIDDIMTVNNLSMALIGCLFAWTALLMAIKAWGTLRMTKAAWQSTSSI